MSNEKGRLFCIRHIVNVSLCYRKNQRHCHNSNPSQCYHSNRMDNTFIRRQRHAMRKVLMITKKRKDVEPLTKFWESRRNSEMMLATWQLLMILVEVTSSLAWRPPPWRECSNSNKEPSKLLLCHQRRREAFTTSRLCRKRLCYPMSRWYIMICCLTIFGGAFYSLFHGHIFRLFL